MHPQQVLSKITGQMEIQNIAGKPKNASIFIWAPPTEQMDKFIRKCLNAGRTEVM